MSSTTAHTDASTKNCVFFIIGAKPGDQKYAEHISDAEATLKEISASHPAFKFEQVGSTEKGADDWNVSERFAEFCRTCSGDITVLVSSPAEDADNGHTLFLSGAKGSGSLTRKVFDKLRTWLGRGTDWRERQMDAILFTSGGHCEDDNINRLPSESRLMSFDTTKEDTGARYIAPLLKAAANTDLKANSWTQAASSSVQVGGVQRPLYQFSWRGRGPKSIIEDCANLVQSQASGQIQISEAGANAQQGQASKPEPDHLGLPASLPLQSRLPDDWVEILDSDGRDDIQSLSDSEEMADAGRK